MLLCEDVYHILIDHNHELIHKHFSSLGQGMLEQQIK